MQNNKPYHKSVLVDTTGRLCSELNTKAFCLLCCQGWGITAQPSGNFHTWAEAVCYKKAGRLWLSNHTQGTECLACHTRWRNHQSRKQTVKPGVEACHPSLSNSVGGFVSWMWRLRSNMFSVESAASHFCECCMMTKWLQRNQASTSTQSFSGG